LISTPLWCNLQAEFNKASAKEEKIYVSPEQIEITHHGIVAWQPDGKNFIWGKSLAFDDKGLYIMPLERGPCGIHKRWCKTCGGCGVLLCPMNCTCYD
jgi:hypothetical protein